MATDDESTPMITEPTRPEYTDAMRTLDAQTRVRFSRECVAQARIYARKATTEKRGEQRSQAASTARIYSECAELLMARAIQLAPEAEDSETPPGMAPVEPE